MIQAPRWKKIKIKGLHLYDISDTFCVRIRATKRQLTFSVLENGDRGIILNFSGRKKSFNVTDLVFKTFRSEEVVDDRNVPTIMIKNKKDQLSANEDDYGLYANKNHWKKMKIEMREIKRLRKLMDQNEQD